MSRYISKFYGIDSNDIIGIYNRVLKGYFYYKGKKISVKTFPNGFWNKEVAVELVRYYVIDLLKMTREEYIEKATFNFFSKARLMSAIKLFNSSTIKLSESAFPEWNIKAWELKSCPNSFLDSKTNCAKIMKWICAKEGIHRNKELFCEKMNIELFRKYGLARAVVKMGGLYNYVEYVYPGKYKPWDLNINEITDDIAIQAVRWLIEEKLKWGKEEVCKEITAKVFSDNGLDSILLHKFNHSPLKALEAVYPGIYTKDMLEKGKTKIIKKEKN